MTETDIEAEIVEPVVKRGRKVGMSPISEQQKLLGIAYLLSGDKARSMDFAGYSYRGAKRISEADKILSKGEMIEYIERRRKTLLDIDDIDTDWIIREIKNNIDTAKKEKKCADVNKGLELLARYKPDSGGGIIGGGFSIRTADYEAWLKGELELVEKQKAAGTALATD